MKSNITDEQIEVAFAGTSFGDRDKRKLLQQGVLKKIAKYRSGSALTSIMRQLGLITEKGSVSSKGNYFLFDAFYDSKNTG